MIVNFVVPFVLLGIRKLRSITTGVIASVGILIGMLLERYIIVVPTLSIPALTRRVLQLLYAKLGGDRDHRRHFRRDDFSVSDLLAKLFPIIAVWEFKPHPHEDEA